jgi:hypothetical protein
VREWRVRGRRKKSSWMEHLGVVGMRVERTRVSRKRASQLAAATTRR